MGRNEAHGHDAVGPAGVDRSLQEVIGVVLPQPLELRSGRPEQEVHLASFQRGQGTPAVRDDAQAVRFVDERR